MKALLRFVPNLKRKKGKEKKSISLNPPRWEQWAPLMDILGPSISQVPELPVCF